MANSTFTEEEKAAMKEAAAERRTAAKRGSGSKEAAADLADCLEKIGAMDDNDRAIGETLHRIVTTHAPDLAPKTWYGMPAYANADGKVVVFHKSAGKFKMRYAEVSFQEWANLDDGDIWPTVFAVAAMTPAVEEQLTALVQRAVR
ncbi:DUF1801 domain-containing protein [Nocardioides sp. KC13]|uniref:DUF1801 domain-containing protein n=1 Tax=Nocardioides turkmenicus TaxID=2711220 RepID=A0A6M1R0L0_9ACTN|nr:DUF1801 domain-containing protein [Nocardioides sp. KC13]NGN95755.1 DUF1801 domain-containing protein [Nocardioides sp. KC13]